MNRRRGLVLTGTAATAVAAGSTTLVAALARAVGVDFEVPDGGETIPLSGIAFVTGLFSLVGVAIAAALLRWSAHPARRFAWTAVALTAISLVPPFVAGASTGTALTLAGLHLVAAVVMVPTLTRALSHSRDRRSRTADDLPVRTYA